MSQPETPEQTPDTPADERAAQAVAALLQLIPEGDNSAIAAALATLAEIGGPPELQAIENHLATAPLSVDYGDRDSDPSPWELTPRAFALLARWWERLGLTDERAADLAASWLGDRPLFGGDSYRSFTLFTRMAPLLAAQVAPPLIAACSATDAKRRARAAAGLQYAPTDAALDTLVALLADRAAPVRNEARAALGLLAHPPSPGSSRRSPSAPLEVAQRLLGALDSDSPAVRRQALECFAWFAGLQHRNSIKLPPLFASVLPAMARLLLDPDAEVQRAAARRIVRAGANLDNLRPSQAAALGLRLPPLDLLPLLDHPEPEVVLAAIYLAGRHPPEAPPPNQSALADRILALFDGLRGDPFGCPAALYALGRLQAVAAIPAIVWHLDQPNAHARIDALLVLARLRYAPVLPQIVRLLNDLTYRADAREALDCFASSEALPLVLAQIKASSGGAGFVQIGRWEASYLEARGDAEALALLRQTESYHFAARYIGAEQEGLVAAARRLERRLLLAAGLSAEEIDDPLATVRRILAGPIHPLECEPQGDSAADHAEQRARWRNLCVALEGWLLADPPPPLGPALSEAERLLAGFPDEIREAHERWWLDAVRGGQLGLPRLSAVARAQLNPKAPWRLARALTINEGIAGAIDPAEALAWPGLRSIAVLTIEYSGWLAALAKAPADFAPSLLRVGLYGEQAARLLAAWPGLERLERLEVLWSRGLSEDALAALQSRTLAARRERAWRTPEGTYLVAQAFSPLLDSYGGRIVRADGSVLAVATTYAELTAAGEPLRVYGGPRRYDSPEETRISGIFEVVGDALQQYEWHEQRPAPGKLTETVLHTGLIQLERSSLPFKL